MAQALKLEELSQTLGIQPDAKTVQCSTLTKKSERCILQLSILDTSKARGKIETLSHCDLAKVNKHTPVLRDFAKYSICAKHQKNEEKIEATVRTLLQKVKKFNKNSQKTTTKSQPEKSTRSTKTPAHQPEAPIKHQNGTKPHTSTPISSPTPSLSIEAMVKQFRTWSSHPNEEVANFVTGQLEELHTGLKGLYTRVAEVTSNLEPSAGQAEGGKGRYEVPPGWKLRDDGLFVRKNAKTRSEKKGMETPDGWVQGEDGLWVEEEEDEEEEDDTSDDSDDGYDDIL